ncbi:MAG: hypothetical protein E7640_03935 [Ruminococcaceae bacterium]|nr:hypothetical protein [Oscillospiraceae bacterium]
MKKRILTFALCLCLILPMLASCAPVDLTYKGPVLDMYITQQIYDFDPLHAYNNEAQLKVVSMLFATLYKIGENGKLEKDLVDSDYTSENELTGEYKLTIKLKSTKWSNGEVLDAEDVLTTIERILLDENSNEAAAVLMDIKGAKEIKQGDATMGDLGVISTKSDTLEFSFTHRIDYDQFKLGLASVALAPLPAEVIDHPDWAKKPITAVYSGPFIVRAVSYEEGNRYLTLERNAYYYRDKTEDAVDKFVTPYRILVKYEQPEDIELEQVAISTPEDQINLYNQGKVLYVGDIPLSLRNDYKESAKISDAMSTHTYYLNQNALVASAKAGEEDGFALFAIKEVRQALSLVIDRTAIAESVVFAKTATGIVPNGVYAEKAANATFRAKVGELIAANADPTAARALLATANINPADYSFSITVRDKDDVHIAIAEAVAAAWSTLGFNVSIVKLGVEGKAADEPDESGEVQTDIRDDLFNEALEGRKFEVIAADLVATAVTASSVLAPFAYDYSGAASYYLDENGKPNWEATPHVSGYTSEDYNTLIKKSYAAEKASERANILADAEKLLVEDMPVIPIVFNQDAYLASSELTGLSSSIFAYRDFSRVSRKNWEKYVVTTAEAIITKAPEKTPTPEVETAE